MAKRKTKNVVTATAESKKPIGNRYLDAERKFFKRHAGNKAVTKQAQHLLDLLSIWQITVFFNIMKEMHFPRENKRGANG